MKKVFILLLMIVLLSGCVNNDEQVDEGEHKIEIFESGNIYVSHFYTKYSPFFGGVYLDEGSLVVCVKDGVPDEGIAILQNSGDLTIKFVTFSYSELNEVHDIITAHMERLGIYSSGISHSENRVDVGVPEDWEQPPSLDYYIEIGLIYTHVTQPGTFY